MSVLSTAVFVAQDSARGRRRRRGVQVLAASASLLDRKLHELLYHVPLANRFWTLAILGLRFETEKARPSRSFGELVQRYSSTHEQEPMWLATATVADLNRVLQDPQIPGGQCSVAEALMQECMHSHGQQSREIAVRAAARLDRRLRAPRDDGLEECFE